MGFRREDFVENVDENLICLICHEVLEDPWQCKKGHLFCSDCIKQWLKRNRTCPMDSNALSVDQLVPSVLAKNMIQNFEVFCHSPDSNDGEVEGTAEKCDWTGKLQSLARHRETCRFQQVQCPNVSCNTNMQRRELVDHDKKCGYKELQCEKCKINLVRRELQAHKDNDCPEELLPCPNGCTCPETGQINKRKRKKLNKHVKNECAKTMQDCPFKDQGCSVVAERQHVDQHVQDNMAAHMLLLAKQCSSLTKENKQLKEELDQVKTELPSRPRFSKNRALRTHFQ